jgi:hypothetical protein
MLAADHFAWPMQWRAACLLVYNLKDSRVLQLSALSDEVAQGASGDRGSTILGRLHLLHVRSGLRYLRANLGSARWFWTTRLSGASRTGGFDRRTAIDREQDRGSSEDIGQLFARLLLRGFLALPPGFGKPYGDCLLSAFHRFAASAALESTLLAFMHRHLDLLRSTA